MARGMFITLEGGEGAGKTTLAHGLASHIIATGREVVRTREPGGTPGAEAIRGLLVTGSVDRWLPLSELLFFYAARHDHLERLIRPALARGAVVLCDRFSDSTRAYQGQAGGAGLGPVEAVETLVVGDSRPDLTLIVDIPPEVGLARAAARKDGETRFEDKALAFHAALRAAYLEIARDAPDRCAVIDGLAAPEQVLEAAWRHVAARLEAHP